MKVGLPHKPSRVDRNAWQVSKKPSHLPPPRQYRLTRSSAPLRLVPAFSRNTPSPVAYTLSNRYPHSTLSSIFPSHRAPDLECLGLLKAPQSGYLWGISEGLQREKGNGAIPNRRGLRVVSGRIVQGPQGVEDTSSCKGMKLLKTSLPTSQSVVTPFNFFLRTSIRCHR